MVNFAQMDKHTCVPCRQRNGTPADENQPPHADCESENGCRCLIGSVPSKPIIIEPEALNTQANVEIFRLVHDRLPTEADDELTLADYDKCLARFPKHYLRPLALAEHRRLLQSAGL